MLWLHTKTTDNEYNVSAISINPQMKLLLFNATSFLEELTIACDFCSFIRSLLCGMPSRIKYIPHIGKQIFFIGAKNRHVSPNFTLPNYPASRQGKCP